MRESAQRGARPASPVGVRVNVIVAVVAHVVFLPRPVLIVPEPHEFVWKCVAASDAFVKQTLITAKVALKAVGRLDHRPWAAAEEAALRLVIAGRGCCGLLGLK